MVTADWLEKAERLRDQLTRLRSVQIDGVTDDPTEQAAQERVTIACWLKSEFSNEPPEDTQTPTLFPLEPTAAPVRFQDPQRL